MKKEKAKRITRRITAFAAAVAMAATFTFPAEVGDGFFDGFGNAIVASASSSDYDYTENSDGTVTINGYRGADQTLIIPSNIDGKTVSCIGAASIVGYTYIISITIPDSVTSIGSSAFAGCINLTSIFLPEDASIGTNAIPNTTSQIKYIVSNNSVTITQMSNVTDGQTFDIPETISGYPVVSVAGAYQQYVGNHTHTFDSNNDCTICGGSKVTVTSISVDPSTLTLSVGQTDNLIANVQPPNATDTSVEWTSSDTAVATVDTGGKVTAVGKGTATIKAAAKDGSGIYGECAVTVHEIGTAFTVTATNGGNLTYGSDYTYENGVLTIKSANPITIANANTGSTTDRIEVADGISANIILAGVNIDVSANDDTPAVRILGNNYGVSTGNVIITIADNTTNILKSGLHWAGLTKPNGNIDTPRSGGWLKIRGGTNGTGILEAVGGTFGAGIGGSNGFHSCDIYIEGGNVSATGGNYGAGIGGGATRKGNNITISGGTVSATGRSGGADVGGGGFGGSGSDIIISGGSVKAPSISCTPTTNGTENVYLLEITNTDGSAITINGKDYPSKHNGEAKIYAYLPAKTAADPNVVTVGTTAKKYCYDTANAKWLEVVDIPAEDPTVFTYTGLEQTYTIAESTYYTVTGNKQTEIGTHTVTVALKDPDKTVWSDGTTADLTYTFKINKQSATVTPPTAPTAISYGETLAETGLTAGWTWEKGSTYMPDVTDNTFSVYMLVDDDNNYDYNNISGISYSTTEHKLSCDVTITVNPATPKITVTASPSSAITGKETTVTVTAEVKNPNNNTLNDLLAPEISYKIGNGAETPITNGSFVISADTPNGTTFTISARTPATANYSAGTGTTTILVSDCTHPDVSDAWETDETYHWHKCPDCGAELDKAEHTSNAAATETSPEVCKDCGYEMSPATGHIHKNHLTFVDRAEPADCTTDGTEAHYECDCGKLFADEQAATEVTLESLKIAAHHTPGTEWVSDNDNNHYHVCSVCGDKTDITEHSYDNGVITTPATEQTTGIKTYTCSECNHTKTEIVPKLNHTHSLATEYSSDATGHWYACSGCTEKVDFESHTEDSGTVTIQPTETTEGARTYKCVKCGYVMRTESIPKTGSHEAVESFVERLYRSILNRGGDEHKKDHIANLQNGKTACQVAYDFVFSTEFMEQPLSNEDRVKRMYLAFLGREADPEGLASWTAILDNGCSIEHVFCGFAQSPEFGKLCKENGITQGTWEFTESRDRNPKLTAFVSRLYTKALNRPYDVDGLNNHTANYLAGGDLYKMAYDFIFSEEFLKRNLSDEDFVDTMYRTFFDREGDPKGRSEWIGKLKSGCSREEVLAVFVYSQECADLVAKFGI